MKRRTNKAAKIKTTNQLLEETLLREFIELGDDALAELLAGFRSFQSPKGEQPAPPHIIAMCEDFQREATEERESIKFLMELERRTTQN